MSCKEFEQHLSAYLDNELDAGARAGLEEHLPSCPDCTRQLDQMRRIGSLKAQLEPPEPTDRQWRECWAGVSRRVAEPAPARRARWLKRIGVGAGIAAAAIVLLVLLLYQGALHIDEPPVAQEESVCVHDYDGDNYNLYIINNPDYTIIRLVPVDSDNGG